MYTGLSRSLDGEREGAGGGQGGSEDGSDSKQCWKERGMRKEELEEKRDKGRREEGDGGMSRISQDI